MRSLLLALLPALLLTGAAARAAETSFIVAVVPQFAPTRVHRDWSPLLSRLERATGYRFQLRAYGQIPRFEAELAQGIPDLAFMNPYHMLIAKRKHGYQPLVRDSSAGLAGILVVRRDGPVRALADLNGKTLAFPSPNALGASLYMRALLAEKEGLRVQPIYVGTHQNVYRKVLMGEAQAGGGVQATLSKEPETVRSRLRILYTTAEIAPHPLAAHPRVPTAARRKIIEALLAMRADEEGRTLLAAVQIPQPIKADYRRDYEHLARLKLERYAEGWGR